MKVICLKNTKKLVKGSIYEVLYLNNLDNKTGHYFRPSVTIKLNDFSNYSFGIANFKLENGKNLPEINWSSDEWKNTKIENSKSVIGDSNPVKVGDYEEGFARMSRSLTQSILVKGALTSFVGYIIKAGIIKNIKELAVNFNDSELLVWAEIRDDDEVTWDGIILAEAKTNAKYHEFAFDVNSMVVEECDNLTKPNHYKTIFPS
jgi:hypothetical protein